MNPLLKGFRSATRPPEPLLPWQWAEKYLVVDDTSPMPGKWRSDNAPWVRDFMEVFADNRVRYIVVKCSAQSSKTQTLLILLCWAIVEDPGPILWLADAKDTLKDFVRDRVSPTFHNCKPVADLILEETVMGFTFSTTPVYFAGAGSKGKVKSKPIRYLLADEVEEYPPGHLQSAMNRTTAYENWNARKVLISTPHMKGGVMDVEFLKGDQRVFHAMCPACGQLQPLKWDQMKWDKDEKTCPDGRWNFDVMASTIRYQCSTPDCSHAWRDTPAERKTIARTGKFIRMNPAAPAHRVSFTWNAILPPWVTWGSLAEEFLNAVDSAKAGDKEPLKSFVNDKLGEAWEDQLGVIEDFGFLEARKGDYDYGDTWPEAKRRFMAADPGEKGGEHYWYVVREFGSFGASRLVTHGKCSTHAELEQIRKDNGVKDGDAAMDTGYQAQQAYRFCMAARWQAFKGDPRDYYLTTRKHPQNPKKTVTVRQLWNKSVASVYNVQTRAKVGTIPLWTFAEAATQDLLQEYMQGLVGDWTLPRNVSRQYMKHMANERREQRTDSKGVITSAWHRYGDQHKRDCEKMILISAIVTQMVNEPVAVAKEAGKAG